MRTLRGSTARRRVRVEPRRTDRREALAALRIIEALAARAARRAVLRAIGRERREKRYGRSCERNRHLEVSPTRGGRRRESSGRLPTPIIADAPCHDSCGHLHVKAPIVRPTMPPDNTAPPTTFVP